MQPSAPKRCVPSHCLVAGRSSRPTQRRGKSPRRKEKQARPRPPPTPDRTLSTPIQTAISRPSCAPHTHPNRLQSSCPPSAVSRAPAQPLPNVRRAVHTRLRRRHCACNDPSLFCKIARSSARAFPMMRRRPPSSTWHVAFTMPRRPLTRSLYHIRKRSLMAASMWPSLPPRSRLTATATRPPLPRPSARNCRSRTSAHAGRGSCHGPATTTC